MALRPLSLAFVIAAVAAGCAAPPRGPQAPASGATPPAAAPGAPTLASEQRRLSEAVRGTPVVVETTPEGRLRVGVPAEFSFAVGSVKVQKPLAAILDLVASGLKQQPGFEVRIAAPADPKGAGGTLLAQDRAASARDYLVARGVPLARFVGLGRAEAAAVEVVVAERGAR